VSIVKNVVILIEPGKKGKMHCSRCNSSNIKVKEDRHEYADRTEIKTIYYCGDCGYDVSRSSRTEYKNYPKPNKKDRSW
jgi:hypothetical protein